MRDKETIYIKYKQNTILLKQKAHHEYEKFQRDLVERVRFFKRKYNSNLSSILEHFSLKSPKQSGMNLNL